MRRDDSNEMVDVDCHIHAKTRAAVLISKDGNEESAVWVPISQVSGTSRDKLERDKDVTIGVKRWIAEREGLV